jgi:predicted ATPase
LRYIGPIRSQGLRFDEVRNLPDRDVGKDGRDAIQLIADDEGLKTQANIWMERLGITYRMDPQRIETSRGAPLLDARIVDARNSLELNLVDVGFGISQVAPIVVQSLLLTSQTRGREEGPRPHRGTLLIEQPELHLHPAMQAELGSLFAEVVSTSSTAQIIAETHSEALILRVMKLIRTGKLDASRVKVLWVDQDDDGHAFVRDLPIDASGEFEVSWPRGFFSERYAELED